MRNTSSKFTLAFVVDNPFTLFVVLLLNFFFWGGKATALPPQSTEAKAILIGNWADPSILKDGDDYYMTHPSWEFQPGILIWHSKDLKNWRPLVRATLNSREGVWTPHLIKYKDHYYIYLYLPHGENWVTRAQDIRGPWSEPVEVNVNGHNLNHVADENGNRYLYVNTGHVARLSEDGTMITESPHKVYEGWNYPSDWLVGGPNFETPMFAKRNGWYYLTCSQGGTAGPATSNMIICARSRSVTGPWENSPLNPVIRTWDRREAFWAKGQGALVEGPHGQWFCVMHGYANGLTTLGRCTLIEPIEWTTEGWCKVAEKWPEDWGENAIRIDMPLSDEFDGDTLGIQWQFFEKMEPARFRYHDGTVEIDGYGNDPGESRPLCTVSLDFAYSIETELEVEGNATAGLMLFYQPSAYVAMALEPDGTMRRMTKAIPGYPEHRNTVEGRRRIAFKIINRRQDVQCFYKDPGGDWVPLSTSMDVAHVNRNVLGTWGGLRPSLFVSGKGKARFFYFKYEPIQED